MHVKDKVVLVTGGAALTGGASGIGRALALRFHQEGARGVTVADLDREGTQAVTDEIGGLA